MSKDSSSIAAGSFILMLYAAVLILHCYGAWYIGGVIGAVAFFMPPLPVFVAVLHLAGFM